MGGKEYREREDGEDVTYECERKRKECNLLCELVSLDRAETRCLVMRDFKNRYSGALKRDTRGSGVAPIVVIAPRCCWMKRMWGKGKKD